MTGRWWLPSASPALLRTQNTPKPQILLRCGTHTAEPPHRREHMCRKGLFAARSVTGAPCLLPLGSTKSSLSVDKELTKRLTDIAHVTKRQRVLHQKVH